MSARPPASAEDVEGLASLYEAKVRAELAAADGNAPGADAVAWSGDVFASTVLVKGDPGPAEVAGGAALSGPDGAAAAKALEALGLDPSAVFGTVARPETGIAAELLAKRLRVQLEAVDPRRAIALDPVAAELLAAACGLERLIAGRPVEAYGRTLLALDGLEASLADERAKKRVWRQLRSLVSTGGQR